MTSIISKIYSHLPKKEAITSLLWTPLIDFAANSCRLKWGSGPYNTWKKLAIGNKINRNDSYQRSSDSALWLNIKHNCGRESSPNISKFSNINEINKTKINFFKQRITKSNSTISS